MRRFLTLTALVACLAAVLAPAAGAASSAAAGAAKLQPIAITGNVGEKPTIEFEKPFSVKSSVSDVRAEGAGDKAAKGSQVQFDYVILNARTGDEIETSYGASPATLLLGKGSPSAIVDGLIGAGPGSRVLVAIAPKDGLTKGGGSVGVKKNDTLLFIMDVKSVSTPLQRAEGTAVAPVDGLPTVTLAKNGKPTITIPKTDPPAALVAQPLIEGDGPVVRAGQTVSVQYTGAIWRNGKVFDSSWDRDAPAQFPIGNGSVIAGWDEGLVGQTVGSQLLLVIPPDQGYGSGGNAQAGIAGTDTLVFVVDILGAS